MNRVGVWWDERLVGWLVIDDGVRPVVEFVYDASWISQGFSIDPELPLSSAPFSRAGSLFGAFSDSAPDTWGRGLLARTHPERALSEAEYLLAVDDLTRQGALRYRDADGRWLTQDAPVPVVTDLDQLLVEARDFEDGRQPATRTLVAAGAGTGGARPKAIVRVDGQLWIAKFGSRRDTIETEVAEHVIARLASVAGIDISEVRLFTGSDEPILLSRRFDRDGQTRRGYLSAHSLLQAVVDPRRDSFDYLELADVLPELCSRPTRDLHELWRRAAFGCLVRNTDDHMRNHGFIREAGGWRLSPAFDINTDVEFGLTSASSVDGSAGQDKLAGLVRSCEYFRLGDSEALSILDELVGAVKRLDKILVDYSASSTTEALREVITTNVRSLL